MNQDRIKMCRCRNAYNTISMLLYYPSFKYVNKIVTNNTGVIIANGIIYLTMCNLIPTILSVIYLIFGIFILSTTGKANWFAIPLVGLNTFGLSMVLVLFFCSMAGTPRYTYVTMCMVHASHIFAYLCYKKAADLKVFSKGSAQNNLYAFTGDNRI